MMLSDARSCDDCHPRYWNNIWDVYLTYGTYWAALMMMFSYIGTTYQLTKRDMDDCDVSLSLIRAVHVLYTVALPTSLTVAALVRLSTHRIH